MAGLQTSSTARGNCNSCPRRRADPPLLDAGPGPDTGQTTPGGQAVIHVAWGYANEGPCRSIPGFLCFLRARRIVFGFTPNPRRISVTGDLGFRQFSLRSGPANSAPNPNSANWLQFAPFDRRTIPGGYGPAGIVALTPPPVSHHRGPGPGSTRTEKPIPYFQKEIPFTTATSRA